MSGTIPAKTAFIVIVLTVMVSVAATYLVMKNYIPVSSASLPSDDISPAPVGVVSVVVPPQETEEEAGAVASEETATDDTDYPTG